MIDSGSGTGLLRILGATDAQVRKLILVEAGLIGLSVNGGGPRTGICAVAGAGVSGSTSNRLAGPIQFHWPVAVLLWVADRGVCGNAGGWTLPGADGGAAEPY